MAGTSIIVGILSPPDYTVDDILSRSGPARGVREELRHAFHSSRFTRLRAGGRTPDRAGRRLSRD